VECLVTENQQVRMELETEKEDTEKKLTVQVQKLTFELEETKKMLAMREETIRVLTARNKELESSLEETSTKLSAKEVEVLTMELENQDYVTKIPVQDNGVNGRKKKEERELTASLLKEVDTELVSKRAELEEVEKLKKDAEKKLQEIQVKLKEMQNQMQTKSDAKSREMDKQLDMIKKQLGEEVFERRRAENEVRELRASKPNGNSSEIDSLKKDKQSLEEELKKNVELQNTLAKVDKILRIIITQQESKLTIPGVKDMLSKLRKGIFQSSERGTQASSTTTTVVTTSSTSNVTPPSPSPVSNKPENKPIVKPHVATLPTLPNVATPETPTDPTAKGNRPRPKTMFAKQFASYDLKKST